MRLRLNWTALAELAVQRNVAVGPDGDPLRMHGHSLGLEVTELLLLLGIKRPLITQLLTHCCLQWKAVYKMKAVGTVAA